MLWLLTCGLLFGTGLPIYYLLSKGLGAEWNVVKELLLKSENLVLLGNTAILALAVLVSGIVFALPPAFFLTRFALPFKRFWLVSCILPLAIPGYIMALGWLSLGGNYGALAQLWGIQLGRPSGFIGAWLALSTALYPYLFLNFRAAFVGMNPALEESAKTMGISSIRRFMHVLLPQLKPALFSGMMLVALHVLGDFGTVSLMRYKTFSYALFLQYEASFDRVYAAWLALFMVFLTLILVFLEANRVKQVEISATKSKRFRALIVPSKRQKALVVGYLILQTLITFCLPLFSILFWFFKSTKKSILENWLAALPNTVFIALIATFCTLILSFGFAYFAVRRRTGWGRRNPILLYAVYSMPPLALGLSLVFFSLKVVPFLYQTLFLLIGAYVLHFMAEAFGPLRSGLFQVPLQLEEAAKSLGRSRFYALRNIVLPLLKKPFLSAFALVFVAILKELPITLLLAPAGFETLAMNVWSYTASLNFGAAAPFALSIVGISALFIGVFEPKE